MKQHVNLVTAKLRKKNNKRQSKEEKNNTDIKAQRRRVRGNSKKIIKKE